MIESSALLAIASRDITKLLRDPARLISTLVFPLVFIGIVGRSMQSSIGAQTGYNFVAFTFTGVFAQTLFQSAAIGIISLIEDRENDFSQEIFVSPVSRYTIILGKIMGESLVALVQGVAVLAFALLLGVPLSLGQLLRLLPVAVIICLFGGAFGVLVLSNLNSQRAAQQIFPFIILPQFFLAGVFTPITVLPWYLDLLSHMAPMRYAVDLARGAYYAGDSGYGQAVLDSPSFNLAVIATLFAAFMVVGTSLFVRRERNR